MAVVSTTQTKIMGHEQYKQHRHNNDTLKIYTFYIIHVIMSQSKSKRTFKLIRLSQRWGLLFVSIIPYIKINKGNVGNNLTYRTRLCGACKGI